MDAKSVAWKLQRTVSVGQTYPIRNYQILGVFGLCAPTIHQIHIPALERCTDLSHADTSDRHKYFLFDGLAEEESSFLASFG